MASATAIAGDVSITIDSALGLAAMNAPISAFTSVNAFAALVPEGTRPRGSDRRCGKRDARRSREFNERPFERSERRWQCRPSGLGRRAEIGRRFLNQVQMRTAWPTQREIRRGEFHRPSVVEARNPFEVIVRSRDEQLILGKSFGVDDSRNAGESAIARDAGLVLADHASPAQSLQ